MSQKRILMLFAAAGIILAIVLGVYAYRSNLGPTKNEVTALLESFIGKIAAGDMEGARALMTEETRTMLRDPGTELGQTVYRELKLKSVDAVYSEGSGFYTADVVLTGLDTMKVMATAGVLFAEQVTETGPVGDTDQAMAEIYEEILSRDDLPYLDNFCIVRMTLRNGELLIVGDSALQQTLEGGIKN